MAATLSQVYQMQSNADLKNRITVAAAKQAYYIISTEDPGTANHANRVIWATKVLTNPESEASKMMWAALQNTDITTAVLAANLEDTLIEYVVNVLVNTFATGT